MYTNMVKDKIAFVGYMGSGKSVLGRRVAVALGWRFVDLDEQIASRVGQTIPQIFEKWGESHFRALEQEILNEELGRDGRAVLSTGGGAPCFYDNMERIKEGALSIYLQIPAEDIAVRLIEDRDSRPLLADKDPSGILDYVQRTLQQRENYYAMADLVVALDDRTIEQNVSYLLDLVKYDESITKH